jgi:hypothetical protein
LRYLTRLKGGWHSLTQRASIARVAFFLTVIYAGAMFWLAPHPPMADLPQHAGQITLWRDLLLGQSPWQSLVNINYFTPYLIGYGLALPLTFLMPVAAALKLLLTSGKWRICRSQLRVVSTPDCAIQNRPPSGGSTRVGVREILQLDEGPRFAISLFLCPTLHAPPSKLVRE